MTTRRIQKLEGMQTPDEGVVDVPFGFTINGTSDPDGLVGDALVSATRVSAGKIKCQARDKAAVVFFATALLSVVSGTTDIVSRVDWSSYETDGTFIVYCLTGTTPTDPADNTLVGGFLRTKKTTRKARGTRA